ncbi:hypothetical protein [Streptosporangium sp. NPDC051022]|uniref:hypothetical protein n=1 Tax=Streptosporangium sp. NPDC051022 TaxID=3155752 RepID=UPI0034458F03
MTLPTPNGVPRPEVQEQAIADLAAASYGPRLDLFNGHGDPLTGAYQACMDALVLAKQAIMERQDLPQFATPSSVLCDWCGTAVATCVVTMTYSPGNQTHFLLCQADAVKAETQGPSYTYQLRCLPLAGEPAPPAPVNVTLVDPQVEIVDAVTHLKEVAARARQEMRDDKHWNDLIPYGEEITSALGGPCGDLAGVFDPDLVFQLAELLDRLGHDLATQVESWVAAPPREPIPVLVEQRYALLLAVVRHINAVKRAQP